MAENQSGGGLLGALGQQGGFRFGQQRMAQPGGTGHGYYNQPGLRMMQPQAAPPPIDFTGSGPSAQAPQSNKPDWQKLLGSLGGFGDFLSPLLGQLGNVQLGNGNYAPQTTQNYAPWPILNPSQHQLPFGFTSPRAGLGTRPSGW